MNKTQHEKNVRQLRCVVSGSDYQIEVHHCHSGSMGDNGWHRGMGQKSNPFLIIPLNHEYHTGKWNPEAIGIRTWEGMFGDQMEHLQGVSDQLGYDVFELARGWGK